MIKHLLIPASFAFLLLLSACAGPDEVRNRRQAVEGWARDREAVRDIRKDSRSRPDTDPGLGQFGVNPGVIY
jgi:hypothetical protein